MKTLDNNVPLPEDSESQVGGEKEKEEPSTLERIQYLCPSRYFHFYMFFDTKLRSTWWLPEGYHQ